MKKIIIAIIGCLALSACSSQYYNGTHKSHPKHTCQTVSQPIAEQA